MMFSMVLNFMAIAKPSAERIVEVLNEEVDLVNPASPVYEIPNGSITFENVNFAYNAQSEEDVLKGVNLSIRSGETVGVIGGTGSAKTTLVSLIPRLYDVKSGSVKVGGVDVRNYDLTALRDGVAMVLQKTGALERTSHPGDQHLCTGELQHLHHARPAHGSPMGL